MSTLLDTLEDIIVEQSINGQLDEVSYVRCAQLLERLRDLSDLASDLIAELIERTGRYDVDPNDFEDF